MRLLFRELSLLIVRGDGCLAVAMVVHKSSNFWTFPFPLGLKNFDCLALGKLGSIVVKTLLLRYCLVYTPWSVCTAIPVLVYHEWRTVVERPFSFAKLFLSVSLCTYIVKSKQMQQFFIDSFLCLWRLPRFFILTFSVHPFHSALALKFYLLAHGKQGLTRCRSGKIRRYNNKFFLATVNTFTFQPCYVLTLK